MIFDKDKQKQSKGEIVPRLDSPHNMDQPSYNKILLHGKNTTQVEEHTPPPKKPHISYTFSNPTFAPIHPTTRISVTELVCQVPNLKTRKLLDEKNTDRYKTTRALESQSTGPACC